MYQKKYHKQVSINTKKMRHHITLNLEQISLMKIPKDHGYYMYVHPQHEQKFTWFSNLQTKMVEDKNGKENKHNLSLGLPSPNFPFFFWALGTHSFLLTNGQRKHTDLPFLPFSVSSPSSKRIPFPPLSCPTYLLILIDWKLTSLSLLSLAHSEDPPKADPPFSLFFL